jgi:hypothetical protein
MEINGRSLGQKATYDERNIDHVKGTVWKCVNWGSYSNLAT